MYNCIIQWNCRGLVKRYTDLKMLLREFNPICVCVQETHLQVRQPYSLRGYDLIRKDHTDGQRASGGVAVIIRNGVYFEPLALRTRLQAVAIRINTPMKITLCNIYLPDWSWEIDDLESIIEQLPAPFVVTGDFNVHNYLWGSSKNDAKGRIIENWLNTDNLALLNTGSATYHNARSNTFDAIDLTLVSPILMTKLTWRVTDDLHNSDHFPIIIETDTIIPHKTVVRRFLTDKANWTLFRESLRVPANVSVQTITVSILNAAELSIPKSGDKAIKRPLPWWNPEVKEAVKNKKSAFRKYQKHPTVENHIGFKRARAISRRIVLESKRKSWNEYTSSITTRSDMNSTWKKIKAINGNYKSSIIQSIQTPQNTITENSLEIANTLANHFANVSSSANYPDNFSQTKNEREIELCFAAARNLEYNTPFIMNELEFALRQCKKTAPGRDCISNEMLINLTPEMKRVLLELYNKLWDEGTYPDEWKEAVVIPVIKPGKTSLDPASYRPISLTCLKRTTCMYRVRLVLGKTDPPPITCFYWNKLYRKLFEKGNT